MSGKGFSAGARRACGTRYWVEPGTSRVQGSPLAVAHGMIEIPETRDFYPLWKQKRFV